MKSAVLGKYIRRLTGRDRSAKRFRELSAHTYGKAYNWALRYTGNADDAQDLVQDTFMAAFEHFDSLQETKKFSSWLFTIMRNRFRKKARQNARYTTVSLDEADGYLTDLAQTAQSVNTENLYERKVDLSRLNDLLSQLGEPYQSPLILYYLEEYSYREIAEILNIPIGTVMSRLSRGKQALKREILRQSRKRPPAEGTVDHATMNAN